ncbi:hypothetical protein BDV41DRAFT_578125 [Aspergillus transmontanensis]|uniref:Uncharacterized protein n=1 Tax=Aspergillus transmontanensis TaxID=1034304 RepID=A0A5N6VTA8_9EURO|nr:hypothetical protein BDV41DRAFT_578125 [Aspergillus transmontanensis]
MALLKAERILPTVDLNISNSDDSFGSILQGIVYLMCNTFFDRGELACQANYVPEAGGVIVVAINVNIVLTLIGSMAYLPLTSAFPISWYEGIAIAQRSMGTGTFLASITPIHIVAFFSWA